MKMITTYSMWNAFRNCRKKCELRYFRNLVPLETARTLRFGSIIHGCLEFWYGGATPQEIDALIANYFPDRLFDSTQNDMWHKARAMMGAYMNRYVEEDFSIVALEKTFQGPIINPSTGSSSRAFELSGKVDGIVEMDGAHYLLEHKTSSAINGGYIEKLWTDFQITLYASYLEREGYKVAGVIYNILGKTTMKQSLGETEEEYQARKAELIAKSKTGKSSAKRKIPESDEEFQARLAEKYQDPAMFHREVIYLSRERYIELQEELWELSQALLSARRRNAWYRNTSFCYHYNRPCEYFPLCQSGENSNVTENLYQIRAPHEELLEDNAAASF